MIRNDLAGLPGADLVKAGLADLAQGKASEAALLVSIAKERLEGLGLVVPALSGVEPPYEHALYSMIEKRNPRGAHSEYNALIRKLVSFARAYELARRA